MQLLLMRHGIAEDLEDSSKCSDEGRVLTDKGRERVHQIALQLKASGLVPSVYLTSPRVRARQTAEIVAATMEWQHPPLVTKTLDLFGSLNDFLEHLKEYPASSVVLATGHEPSMGEWFGELITGAEVAIPMKKGAVAILNWYGPVGEVPVVFHGYLTAWLVRRLPEV
ncbi:MAG: phosphohistidine phosphatase SixA [Candidatus Sumerlaeia bacterium]|nr:phosphohistidine phosphatase SixA [Candidatus Sumerlaeia bacterium]